MNRTRLGLLLAAFAVAIYVPTWAGRVTWGEWGEDGAELEGALRTMGVPHPTGYPLFVVLGRAVAVGLPLPWSAANLVSLLAAVAAVAGVGLVGEALGRRLFPRGSLLATGAGALAGIVFAVSRTWWGQAGIGEVYTLHLALTAGVLVLVLDGGGRSRLVAAYLLGLGLAHHRLMLPVLALVVAYRVLVGDRRVRGTTVLAFVAPLTLYLVLPLRSRFDPPFDWGDPEGLSALWDVVSGAPYRGYLLADGLGAWLARAGRSLALLPGAQLGVPGTALALLGLGWLWRRAPREAFLLTGLVGGSILVAAAYAIPDPAAYYLPAILGLSLAAGLAGALLFARVLGIRAGFLRAGMAAALLALLLVPVSLRAARVAASLEARSEAGFRYAAEGTASLAPRALVVSHGDGRTFSLWYGVHVLSPRPDVVVLYDNLLDWTWYRRYLADRWPEVQLPAPGTPREAGRRLLVERNLPLRPVYLTEPEPGLPLEYRAVRAGPLYRLGEAERPPAPAAGSGSGRPGQKPQSVQGAG